MMKINTGVSFKSVFFSAILALGLVSCNNDDASGNQPAPVAIDYHQTAKTQFVEAGGTKYAYRILGDQSGVPLVMLASLGSSMDDWDPAITNGLAQKHKVILFDNKGVGSSTGQVPATIGEMAKDAVTFIKAMGLTKVDLMGFSMGGFITQQVLLDEPALVRKAILTGTGPKGSEGLSNLPNIIASTANLTPEETFLTFGFTKSEASQKAGKASYARVQARKTDRDEPLSQQGGGAQLGAVLAWAKPYPNALAELKTIQQPVLLVQGKNDVPVPVVNAINASQSIPNANLVVYPDAGHAAFCQYADRFVQEAIDFLGE
ncbi:Pimeloyl-ACP methyl ester carboxylesterase [Dyadobacter soli]|uniref:Pimeloyl-ACP methyl ester carboxylesterase n=1 Tax=Dyadobacter soli TaxID=659014 RepID=A0A1G6X2U7_9BACT|nr:alpha/beta hydrolase [Dyadobacter soli]SDD71616.1 Pimeloyl-ACP methyl ester carboxylesterase [Dyadobacter soli]